MNRNRRSSKDMVVRKTKKDPSCSTPEHKLGSPSRDSDCDSEANSPVPFLCTQDGAERDIDVVWNYYTPKSDYASHKQQKNSTPLSTKLATSSKLTVDRAIPKRYKSLKTLKKKTEMFQELIELNQNINEFIGKDQKNNCVTQDQPGSEEELFNNSVELSPKSGLRGSSRCLRKNLLSSKFGKSEVEMGIESDDSLNECLLKASQVVEEKLLKCDEPTSAKQLCHGLKKCDTGKEKHFKPDFSVHIDQDSMDAILSNVKLASPASRCVNKIESSSVNNDTFDNLVGNLNDSALEMLSQMPVKDTPIRKSKYNAKELTDWTVKEFVVHGESPLSKTFARHNSMPESPSLNNVSKPSTSGMVFGRYNSMPYENNTHQITGPGDSPIRCTPDEIRRKHQQAREKLMAKRLPFTSQLSSSLVPATGSQLIAPKKGQFNPKVPSRTHKSVITSPEDSQVKTTNPDQVKLLIEKKRQEALLKLRRRQPKS